MKEICTQNKQTGTRKWSIMNTWNNEKLYTITVYFLLVGVLLHAMVTAMIFYDFFYIMNLHKIRRLEQCIYIFVFI